MSLSADISYKPRPIRRERRQAVRRPVCVAGKCAGFLAGQKKPGPRQCGPGRKAAVFGVRLRDNAEKPDAFQRCLRHQHGDDVGPGAHIARLGLPAGGVGAAFALVFGAEGYGNVVAAKKG
jgi:hypothetical protein